MKISIESYGNKYTHEFATDDIVLDKVVRAFAFLLTNAGYHQNNITELFKDGWPGNWDVD